MNAGSHVWIRRTDFDEHHRETTRTIGKGIIMAVGSSFCRVFGADNDQEYSFNEWLPIQSRRLN